MAFKFISLVILSVIVFTTYHTPAPASIFENTAGIYKIHWCKNNAVNPSPWDLTLCDNIQLTIYPSIFGTSFNFSKWIDSEQLVRTFGLPSNMATHPNGKYVEKGDYFAAYTNDDKGVGEIFVIRKLDNNLYHLSMHRRSDLFKTFDMFELEVEKTADGTEPSATATNTKSLKQSKAR